MALNVKVKVDSNNEDRRGEVKFQPHVMLMHALTHLCVH